MDYSGSIVALLCENPSWSSTAVARRLGCEQRRVRRYRRLLKAYEQPLAELRRLPPPELRAMLNVRPSRPAPDFNRLRDDFPHLTSRPLWRRYVEGALAQGQRPVSYSHFMRHMAVWSVRAAGRGEPR